MISWEHNIQQRSKTALYLLSSIMLPPKPALVLDIDETLIDLEGVCMLDIIRVYNLAIQKGITVFIVTARVYSPWVLEKTQEQLNNCGVDMYKGIFFRDSPRDNPATYKKESRERISREGYNIVMSIGDQPFDVNGGYTGIGIKLPQK